MATNSVSWQSEILSNLKDFVSEMYQLQNFFLDIVCNLNQVHRGWAELHLRQVKGNLVVWGDFDYDFHVSSSC